jgi:hypothetical protein
MVERHLGKRKWLILVIATILAVVLSLAAFQLLVNSHMYPQDAIEDSSNLSIKGMIISIEYNYRRDGLMAGSYHIFQSYIRVNLTGVVWVDGNLIDWITVDYSNNTVNGWHTIGIGCDNLDNPQLAVGQTVECKGYYVPNTDTPYSFIITVSPSISESYLKTQTDVTTETPVSTAGQAIKIAMPRIEAYAEENHRTVKTVTAKFHNFSEGANWEVVALFDLVKGAGLQDWIDGYSVLIKADTGEIYYANENGFY